MAGIEQVRSNWLEQSLAVMVLACLPFRCSLYFP